jgi:transcriptional regulator GlxA family with amidase domain
MRLENLEQTARVAIVAPSGVRLGSAGVLIDCFDRASAWVRRQYGAIDVLLGAEHFDIVDVRLLTSAAGSPATESGVRWAASAPLDTGGHHVVVVADHAFGAVDKDEQQRLGRWLAAQAEDGAVIAACGASVALLGETGLLDGRRATAPWMMAGIMRDACPRVRFDFDIATIEDGPFHSSAGAAADFDLAVRLVEAVTSQTVAHWLRRVLSRADAVVGTAETDPLLTRAQHWLTGRLSQPTRIEDLARAMQVSRRTLHRHFVDGTGDTPIAYLQALRIGAAMRMLERTGFSVDRVAALVGYGDTAFFRQAFRRKTGMTPRRWRAEHGRVAQSRP